MTFLSNDKKQQLCLIHHNFAPLNLRAISDISAISHKKEHLYHFETPH
jgi:hypothetical protein